ncbi:hypothetical protein J7W19_29605 [Streptomyces mobaraensis NBRC 13819 = DSM 40847]|nr:hypothetical protein J7W19_29605 [Streptomyces mobaraensis NBRC 13819 = DSM 40847]
MGRQTEHRAPGNPRRSPERQGESREQPTEVGPVSAHTVIRYADWAITPDTTAEAPPLLHEMACTTCGDLSGTSEDFEKTRDWAFRHAGRNPSHIGYREIIHRSWRATLVR